MARFVILIGGLSLFVGAIRKKNFASMESTPTMSSAKNTGNVNFETMENTSKISLANNTQNEQPGFWFWYGSEDETIPEQTLPERASDWANAAKTLKNIYDGWRIVHCIISTGTLTVGAMVGNPLVFSVSVVNVLAQMVNRREFEIMATSGDPAARDAIRFKFINEGKLIIGKEMGDNGDEINVFKAFEDTLIHENQVAEVIHVLRIKLVEDEFVPEAMGDEKVHVMLDFDSGVLSIVS